ncbi:MAG TPA: hypothetical protein DCW46_02995 [Desulfotomaculum sp.]|nr:hypothetical protein [Desulfotomaculum sp.]
MKKSWYLRLLVLLLAAGMIAAGMAAVQRYRAEKSYRTVELAMSYDELQSLARQAGKTVPEVMRVFRESGLTTVLFKEPGADELSNYGNIENMTGQEVLAVSRLGGQPLGNILNTVGNSEIKPDYTYFFTNKKDEALQLSEQLRIKTGKVKLYQNKDYYIISTSADYATLKTTGLGFPGEPLKESDRCGLLAVVQLRNWQGADQKSITGVFKPLKNIPNLSAVAFNDPSVPGYPKQIPYLAKEISSLGVPVTEIEFFAQRGLTKLAILLDKHLVRLHTVRIEEMPKYETADLENRYILAASERNIRVLLIRPLTYYKTGDPLSENASFISNLKKDLEQKGLKTGKASSLPPMAVSRFGLFIMGLGVISGGLLLLERLAYRIKWWVLGIAAIIIYAALLAVALDPARKLMAFAAVIIFPTLSLLTFVRNRWLTVWQSIIMLAVTCVYSLIGALFTVGLLSDSAYILKLNSFMGVKAAHILPLAIIGLIFLVYSGTPPSKAEQAETSGNKFRSSLANLLDQPVLIKWALAGAVLLAILAVYVMRTGNEVVVHPSTLELKFRALLDNFLGVRPRTKEFLLGQPFLLLLFYTGYRGNACLPLLLLGAIGQISIVNTFAHLHTPLLVSLLRFFNGFWSGIIIGLVLILILNLAVRWRKANEHCKDTG